MSDTTFELSVFKYSLVVEFSNRVFSMSKADNLDKLNFLFERFLGFADSLKFFKVVDRITYEIITMRIEAVYTYYSMMLVVDGKHSIDSQDFVELIKNRDKTEFISLIEKGILHDIV